MKNPLLYVSNRFLELRRSSSKCVTPRQAVANQSQRGFLDYPYEIQHTTSCFHASADNSGVKKMKVQFATGPLLKFQICVS
ncbi:hypothetical protein Q8A67_009369 [Cirrhinus molitorella]|uniref:Uncharacterized protein n=1 Tax=Cirrhinus molitorella TaxID=172907 RepID=A0AA88PS51_9TELE|nr:hypothetical protein Q8A67_009369 [Cirrhinus molitorella]